MTQQLEDALRAAFQEKADQIPAIAPPLQLAPQPRAMHPARARGHSGWLTPGQQKLAAGLAAAAAVAAVAVATVVASAPPAPPAVPAPAGPATNQPPPYYVALGQDAQTISDQAVVRATGTGAVIASIPVPHPYTNFAGVTSAADDRTFVLEAVSYAGPSLPPRFYLLRIDPGTRLTTDRARLTPLTVRPDSGASSGNGVAGMALSPDGRSLAVVVPARPGVSPGNRIIIYDLSTGASHSWEGLGCRCLVGMSPLAQFELNTISWTADGRQLGFVVAGGAFSEHQFRLLNVPAQGDNVLADSRPVTLGAAPGVLQGLAPRDVMWGVTLITPDGGSIIMDAAGGADPPGTLLRYSARTGRLEAVLGTGPSQPGSFARQVLWTSSDGSRILVIGFRGIHSAGVLHDGQYTPIPWSAQLLTAAW